jgi:transcriptional regulator with XRE-family HTH domain
MALRTDGKALRDTREHSGIGQNELAASAGISAAYLSQIENGLRQPRPQVARRLAKALNVPLAEITEAVTEAAS